MRNSASPNRSATIDFRASSASSSSSPFTLNVRTVPLPAARVKRFKMPFASTNSPSRPPISMLHRNWRATWMNFDDARACSPSLLTIRRSTHRFSCDMGFLVPYQDVRILLRKMRRQSFDHIHRPVLAASATYRHR